MFPILQSPPDMALNFRTCQLHTAWELLHENGGNERQAAWHGQLHWQGRGRAGGGGTMYFALTISAPLSPTAQLSLYDQTFKSLKHHYSHTVRARDLKF